MTIKSRILPACWLLLAATFAVGFSASDSWADEPEFKFTSVVFTDRLDQVVLAITRAFTNGSYHGKEFFAPPYDFIVKGPQRIAVPLTNAWHLCVPDDGWLPLTLIPSGKQMVAYDENFFIKAEAVGDNATKVGIRTGGAGTTDGSFELSPHFARVLREKGHDPLPAETTKLFLRIEAQLAEARSGRTNAPPPTTDIASGYYLHFWKDMDTEQKHDRRNWEKMVQAWKDLQAGHDPYGGANGGQPLSSATNSASAGGPP